MADITITMSVPEAQQMEAALSERINGLAIANHVPGSFEAACVAQGLDFTSRAYHKLVIALYPYSEAETASLWEQSKRDMDALIAADIAGDPSVAWHYDLDR